MRAKDAALLLVPGFTGSGPLHWQSRWATRLSTARRIEQDDWLRPDREAWSARIVETVAAADKPVVLIAHSCGVLSTAHAAHRFEPGRVAGAFLVAPPDLAAPAVPEPCCLLAPTPLDRLPFPSFMVASRTDPYCDFAVAERLAASWGSLLFDAGAAGHINTDSGHGPWPEGLLLLARFLRRL